MNTDLGGVPVFRMAWDTLGMDKIVASSGILRNGIPTEKLTFAAVFKCVSRSSSNASFENSSSDPAFAKVCGLDHIDQVTLSRFMNDDRYDWTDLLTHTVQALSSYPAFVPKSSGYLVIMVCIAYILVELLKVLLPSLSDETLESIVETLIQYSTRISIRDGRLTVLVHSDFAYPKALRQFQLARAG